MGPASSSSQRLSRRQVLQAGLAGAAGFAVAACGSTVRRAASVPAAGSDLEAVRHVVFLMLENRSFDHLFGSYRGVRGFDDAGNRAAFSQRWPGGAAPDGRLLPFHLDTATHDASCTWDLTHNWGPQHACWDHGAMDRFVATHIAPANEGPVHGPLTMGYYTRADLPFLYALADAFTICDRYHCSVLGPTHPNRLFAVSATNDPGGTAGGPVLVTSSLLSAQFSARWTSMPEVLEDAGVSWKVYDPAGAQYQPGNPASMLISDNIMLYFSAAEDPASPLHQKAFGPIYPSDFAADVASGQLPSVSWIIPALGHDGHPPAPMQPAEALVDQVLSTLVANPELWASTVLFVTFDENDGFFDHVPPPVPPAGTAGEYVTVSPLPAAAAGVAGPIGLGMRVPMLVVSPFSRGGYVCSDVFDHTSQLRFLETRFGTKVPNLSEWRRRSTGDLSAAVSTAGRDTTVPSLPSTPDPSPVVKAQCTAMQLLELESPMGAYPISFPQRMPTQEPGTARRRRR